LVELKFSYLPAMNVSKVALDWRTQLYPHFPRLTGLALIQWPHRFGNA
jgi:hypothetical protein